MGDMQTKSTTPRTAGVFTSVVLLLLGSASYAAEPSPLPADEPQDTAGTDVAQADAEVESDDEGAEGEDADTGGGFDLPVGISASIGTGFALGTVFRDSFTTTDSLPLNLGLGVDYSFWEDRLSASASFSYTKNLTPTGINRRYEGRFQDIGLGLGYGNIYTIPVAEIGIGASVGLTLPVSEISRWEGLITSGSAGLSLSRGFGLVSLSYSLDVSKNFYRYTTITANVDRRRDLDLFYREGGAEQVAENRVAIDTGILPEWSVTNSLNLGVRWFETGLSSSVGFSLSDSFTFAVDETMERDEFTSEFARVGRGRSQAMVGSIGLRYSFLDHFGVGVNLSTSQSPKTADNQHFRFPFWDTQTGNLTATRLGFNFSASI